MTPASFSRPASVAEALALLADPATTPLAGGTDYFANRVGKLPDGRLVDLSGVDAQGRIARAAVAVGACSPVARRLAALERRLVGMALTDLPRLRVRDDDLQGLDPLDDIRATRAYRLEAAAELVRRVLVQGCKS